jgi:hypothetical protein
MIPEYNPSSLETYDPIMLVSFLVENPHPPKDVSFWRGIN